MEELFKMPEVYRPVTSLRMSETKKRKVLFVIDTLQLGGAEQSLLENTSRFKDIDPVVCHIYTGAILEPKFREKGVKVYSLNIPGKYAFIEAYRKLKKIVADEQPELMVAYLTRSEIVTRLLGKFNRIPVVGTFVNDLYCKSYNQHLSWKAKNVVSIFKYLNKATSKICVGFVSNSEAIKDANAKHLNIRPEKIQVINRGRDSFKFRRRLPETHATSGSIRFLNVSRLFAVKGHRFMILGFKQFTEKYPDASLTIVGDGPLRNELASLIKENGLEEKVTLLGARNDVPALLPEYDCFVFPSLVEGFSGAIVEAMFAGLPILASDIAQNKEAVKHLETGYLFQRESPEAVAQAMTWFKENREEANRLSGQAYEYAKENFELDTIVNRFESYLQQVIPEKI